MEARKVKQTVYVVMAQDKGPDDAESVSYIVGIYGTKASAESARRRHADMMPEGVSGFAYVDAQEVRP